MCKILLMRIHICIKRHEQDLCNSKSMERAGMLIPTDGLNIVKDVRKEKQDVSLFFQDEVTGSSQ